MCQKTQKDTCLYKEVPSLIRHLYDLRRNKINKNILKECKIFHINMCYLLKLIYVASDWTRRKKNP